MSDQPIINRPEFSAIGIDKIEAQLDLHLTRCRHVIDVAASVATPDWASVIQPQEEANNKLELFWSPISHLNSVMNNEALRDVYNRCLPKLSAFHTEVGQNKELYNTTLALRDSVGFNLLDSARQQTILNDIRGFELGGVALHDDDKKRFSEVAQALSKLATEFSDNVLDATNIWEKRIDDVSELIGLPASAINAAKQRADAKGLTGWLLNLEFPVYYAVLTFAENSSLREEIFTAFNTRASDQGPYADKFDNSSIIDQILALRREKASLLGYTTYAELSVVPKMVESPRQVLSFLNDLAEKAVPLARQEYQELTEFAAEFLGLPELSRWDVAFASDKLKQQRYAISDDDLKPYFPANIVIPGMFAVVGKLFGLRIDLVAGVDVYHPDVQCYSITDQQGQHRGDFYLDNFAREHKRGGAWMDVCAMRQKIGQHVQLPIAYLTCNLTPPVGDDPALLTHSEVTTLFHEFGHGLHHMLTRIDTSGVSGIAGVEWDAVELPSQFLENWCWERESLDMISGHYQTGERLPEDLLKKLRDARNFQSAMTLVRQLEFSLFDMHIHNDITADAVVNVQAILERIRDQVAVSAYPDWVRFQHAFSHIFAGGYSAGYFSYKWAEVLSADAFSRFEEEGIFNTTTGQDFLNEILVRGGSRKAMESFVAFRGREPVVDALLRHNGLAA